MVVDESQNGAIRRIFSLNGKTKSMLSMTIRQGKEEDCVSDIFV